MGRGKGKSKKGSTREDGSGEEEKLPVKRRGRPTKAQKEEETEKIQENVENKVEENGNKRKNPPLQTEDDPELVEDENGVELTKNGVELTKNTGFRHNGSRRKNKPRRAAEVGVSVCEEVCSWLVLGS